MNRRDLKRAILALLDALADAHPLGHQSVYAARYILKAAAGGTSEIMFEKDDDTPSNIWVAVSKVPVLVGGSIKQISSLAGNLRSQPGKKGVPMYGRHSALEGMSELGNADLICFKPANLEEVGQILDVLLA